MKQLFNIYSNASFYLILGFLFLINFSIAGSYLLFTLLLIQACVFFIIRFTHKDQPPALSHPPFPGFPPYYKYFLLYIFFTLLSSLFGLNPAISLKHDKEFFIYLLIPLFLLILHTPKRLKQSLMVVLLSTTLSAAWGILTVIRQKGVSLDYRLKGFLSHWMTYSGLLMLAFIFFFIYVFHEPSKKRKIPIGIGLAIILTTIGFTLTRSIWVGTIAALGLFVFYARPKLLYFIPVCLIIALFLPGPVKDRAVSIIDMNNATNKDRFFMASIALNIFKDYPLTGVGPNNIRMVYDRYKPAQAEQTNMHLHNNFLHVLAERGIFALLALLSAFVSIIVALIRKIKHAFDLEKTLSVCTLFTFIGFIVAGFFEYNYGDSEVRFLLYYVLTLPFLRLNPETDTQIETHAEVKG
ncbi:MAG: O-antigen ligase family protein [Candidatus Omnitrophota bacterium]